MTEAEWLACDDPKPMLDYLCRKCSDRQLRLFACACANRLGHVLDDDRARRAVAVAERLADGGVDDDERRVASGLANDLLANSEGGLGFRFFEHFRTTDGYARASLKQARAEAALAVCNLLHPDPHADNSLHWVDSKAADSAGWSAVYAAVQRLPVLTDIANMGGNLPKEGYAVWAPAVAAERAWQAQSLRDIVGDPFRPAALDSALQTPTVLSLAQSAYQERALPSGELEPARLAVLADALEEAGCSNEDILGHLRSAGPHVRGCWALDLVLGKE